MDRLLSLSLIDQAGNIAAASQQSGKSQSLLSRQVSELEGIKDNYKGKGLDGVSLLNREVIPHVLTEEGEHLARMTQEFVHSFDQYVNALKKEDEVITIAAGESIILWLLIPLLSEKTNKIRFRNMRSRQAFEAMKKGVVDIAIHHEKDGEADTVSPPRWSVEPVGGYELQVIVEKSLLRGKTVKKWRDLEGINLPVATLEGGGSTRKLVEKLCAQAPSGPQISLECTSHPQIIEACRKGRYIGIVPQIAKSQITANELSFLPMEELSESKVKLSCSSLVRRYENSPLMREVYRSVIGG